MEYEKKKLIFEDRSLFQIKPISKWGQDYVFILLDFKFLFEMTALTSILTTVIYKREVCYLEDLLLKKPTFDENSNWRFFHSKFLILFVNKVNV